MDELSAELRFVKLEQRTRMLRLMCFAEGALLLLISASLLFDHFGTKQTPDRIVHARGLVIEDAEGHARVLLGAPFPSAPGRKRQDSPTEAMVFLDENGNDRLILGEGPEPRVNGKILQRTAQSFGVLIHDTLGNERGGFGWLSNGKAIIALDRPNQDAWAAIVDDKTGFAGTVNLFSPDVASRNTTGVLIGTQGKKAFVHVKDTNDKDRAVLDVEGDALPTLKALDGSGGTVQDLFSKH